MPQGFRAWFKRAKKAKSGTVLNEPKWKNFGKSLKGKIPREFGNLDLKKIELKNVSQYSKRIRWGLLILAVFLAAEVTSGIIGLFIRPVYTPMPKKGVTAAQPRTQSEDYGAIERRNIFNVEGKIPDPFDQGLLDCLSQAKPSNSGMQLLGTIVMNDERLSVALVSENGSPQRIGVKKDDNFFDKYIALKVERKKLCFQVKASQELEFIEIPDDSANLGVTAGFSAVSGGGIVPKSETEFEVKRSFLEEKLTNLTDILQTARAVPYVEPGTGKFKGFLVQSVDSASPFAQLGIRQGDILTGVNDIPLDNPGKGLEAFQTLRNSPKIGLRVIRGGSEQTLNFEVK